MTCENIVSVKNILIRFTDCETGQVVGPISHKQATEELPTIKACDWVNEALPGGFVRRTASNAGIEMNVIRDLRVPLAWYQGCAAINVQIEYTNGLVYTATDGSALGEEKSDTHEVMLDLSFEEIDELLPDGAVSQVAA